MTEQVHSNHFIGHSVHHFSEINSTNDFAKQLIAKSEPVHGTVIMADHQLKGRGQSASNWLSAPGKNILLSILFQPKDLPIHQQFLINMLISVAISETIEYFIKQPIYIKWPNDILIDNSKVCGILIENFLSGSTISHIILGIGMNVNQIHFHSTLKEATSLKVETGLDFDRQPILNLLYKNIEQWLVVFDQNKFSKIKRSYFQKLYRYQEVSLFEVDGERVMGEIIGVNDQGKLQVKMNGELRSFANKEIRFL